MRDVRLAELSDLERVETIVEAAYESHLNRMGFPPSQLLRDDTEAIEAGEIWVLGQPIVGAIILIETDDTLLVENLAVEPRAQGAGVGRQLMEFAEQLARDLGLRRVALHHNDVNIQHQAFFEHLGYASQQRRSRRGPTMMFMEKRLLAAV